MTPDLTKWPRLLVTGVPVTPEQANEILIRTNDWDFVFTNDKDWLRQVERMAADVGRPIEPGMHIRLGGHTGEYQRYQERLGRWCAELGILDLAYLVNDRIASAWIDGPHGWCDWDGTIGCSTYNIGKCRSVEEVNAEWTHIAAAFPFLDLRAQLVPNEGKAKRPAVEWVVKDGVATLVERPRDLLPMPSHDERAMIVDRFGRFGERGVDAGRLREALEQVASRRKERA